MKESFEPKKDSQKNTTPENKKGTMANIRKAFLAGAVTLSSMFPPAEAQKSTGTILATNVDLKKVPKIENSTVGVPQGDAKALEIGIFNPSDTFEIKIANYYETDKAEISVENREQISENLSGYLLGLSRENVKAFLKNNVVLRISCDPRHTNFTGPDGKAGNLYLAQARGVTAQTVVQDIIAQFPFEKIGLTQEEISQVREKFNHIIVEIPLTQTETKQGEDGVVDYHKVINPDTNKPYTDADWVELHKPGNEEKKLKAYENFRYANLSLVIPNIHTTETIPIPEKPPFNFDGYEKAYVLFDDSPSMKDWREYIAEKLGENKIDIPVEVNGFTSKIDTTFYAKNIHEAADVLKNIKLVDDPDEFALNGIITKLHNIDDAGKNDTQLQKQKKIIIACSDEYLQKVNKEKLEIAKKLAEQNNITVEFSLVVREWHKETNEEWKEVRTFTLPEIDTAYDKIYQETIKEKVENYQKNLDLTKRYLQTYEAEEKAPKRKKSEIKKDIAEAKDDISRYTSAIENAQTISMGNLSTEVTKPKSTSIVNN